MITRDRVFNNGSSIEGKPQEYYGLSTDDKPIDDVINGSTLYLIDTQEVYMFDEENATWVRQ